MDSSAYLNRGVTLDVWHDGIKKGVVFLGQSSSIAQYVERDAWGNRVYEPIREDGKVAHFYSVNHAIQRVIELHDQALTAVVK